jgi:tetratricopeptide (TPR) repeat protein
LKKVLSVFLSILLVIVVSGGIFVWWRSSKNPEQVFPYPYKFSKEAPGIKLDAPILIVGDRMGAYLAKFQAELSATISQDLTKNIRVQTLARENWPIHRTLHDLKSLSQWPQILIYQGGSEEFLENKFETTEIKKILTNIHRYNDDRLQTLLILWPWFSRVLYEPVKLVPLQEELVKTTLTDETSYLKRLEMEMLLYEEQLTQLVNQSRDRNSLLILTTVPLNLDSKPRRACSFTTTNDVEKEIQNIEAMMVAENFKEAYARASKAALLYSGNAKLFYLYGQVSAKFGKLPEARDALLKATAYDCEPWRSSEMMNMIIRRVANKQQVLIFDFALMTQKDWPDSVTFFDDIYPQNLYYEKGMKQLGLVIKNILKL